MIKLEPNINWIPFDKDNPPIDLANDTNYLIFLREDDFDNGATWTYSVDIATAYGRYLDNFWDTENDWKEGQRVEVLAYAEFPYGQNEADYECNCSKEELETCDRCIHDGESANIVGSSCYLCKRNPTDNRIDWFEEKRGK